MRVRVEVLDEEGVDEGVGAADDDREVFASGDVGDEVGGMVAEVGGGELAVVIGVDVAEEVVGDAAALGGGNLVGGDVEAAVDLHFVGVDDFGGGEEGCKVDGETGLAGAGGAHDHHHLVFAAVERRVHTGPLLYRVAAPVCVWVGLQNGKSHNGKWVGKGRRQKQKVCGCGWVYGIFRNGIPKCLIEFPQLIDR